jgi:protoporphyrinogen oxidase
LKVGRIQNFNNWSRAMVPYTGQTCLGMEYFCSIGDEVWKQSDADLIGLATRELGELKLSGHSPVVDAKVVRVPKAYPVYDSSFHERVETIREFLEPLANFHTVGRNGMHKYNNQDHSMMAALLAVKTMQGEWADVWDINTELEYHEEQRLEPSVNRGARKGRATGAAAVEA